MSLEWLDSLVEEDELADFIMEYLPGVEYSVDVLCYEGKPEIIIPRERKMVVDGKAVVSRLLRHEGLITVSGINSNVQPLIHCEHPV